MSFALVATLNVSSLESQSLSYLGKVGFIFAHSHIYAFNNFVNLHQKRLISVSYHYRLL